MAEVQDDEQWLYGDDKENSNITPDDREDDSEPFERNETEQDTEEGDTQDAEKAPTPEENGEMNESVEQIQEESQDAEQNGDKSKDDDADEDSSSDDEPTITIGKIVKQPDVMRPPPPAHRSAPTTGLKDEDFNNSGKINGVQVPDFNLAELEEKPWRKPGADLSDYFNYGFTEETWIKYCERQKRMRTSESGIGLGGLGINMSKGALGSSNISVSIVNENSKYGGLRKPAGVPTVKPIEEERPGLGGSQPSGISTIQVMTADRRTYSNKVLNSGGGNYDDMDFGENPYGDYFAPPPNFYTPPPPPAPWGGVPNIPPPGWAPDGLGVPPPMQPHHRNIPYFDEDSMGPIGGGLSRAPKDDRERDVDRARERESRDHERDSRERDQRHHSNRRRSRSRSRSKSRHRKRSRTRSRSRSPSHRHKRKKSKRERETD